MNLPLDFQSNVDGLGSRARCMHFAGVEINVLREAGGRDANAIGPKII
jgi:hypothetical protein